MNPPRAKKQKCAVGDIFCFDLGNGRYGLARIINLKDGWDLAEAFSNTSATPNLNGDPADAETLYPPFFFDIRDVERGALPIIHRTAGYVCPYLDNLRFVRGIPGRRELIRVNEYRPDGLINEEEAARLPVQKFYVLERMIKIAKEIIDSGRTTREWLAEQQ
ncbi:MAG TPA: Imm26 family immunity protein [Rhizobium sp.]|nr:Imm26 family immunity protein [Rhizobium sp.]